MVAMMKADVGGKLAVDGGGCVYVSGCHRCSNYCGAAAEGL